MAHRNETFGISAWIVRVKRSLSMQSIKREAGEFLCHFFRIPVVGNGVPAVRARRRQENEGYNWPNISDQRCSDGLFEGAGEGLSGKRRAFEESPFSVGAENARLLVTAN
jgi:hypothetical protein